MISSLGSGIGYDTWDATQSPGTTFISNKMQYNPELKTNCVKEDG